MEKKVNIPKKGAGKRLAQKLKDLSKQPPPEDLLKKINQDENKKVAIPQTQPKELDI
jgi:hypothetical protein